MATVNIFNVKVGAVAAWNSSLTGNYTWANWKLAAFKCFGGGIETVIAKLKEVDQTHFKTTEEFIEELNTLLNQYQDLVYISYDTLEGKRTQQTFLENQGLDWVCETLTSEYYQFVESHALSNVERHMFVVFGSRGQHPGGYSRKSL
ncbi:hypothetical protein DSO57_1017744 [Entomophthora muscae]|uniref:Uncharacterized protein n=1 Tax=Entomophthora muscae TaxID=34485 RepID=A0ACC2UQC9_9FUNG|nr:hypothetical protein DSO57_1017744 [Entomophthora muscae]